MPAITISRVSTEDQKIQGNSLPAQEKRMVDYCNRKGFEVVKKFSFDESAYKTNRDEFDKTYPHIIQNQNKKVVLSLIIIHSYCCFRCKRWKFQIPEAKYMN